MLSFSQQLVVEAFYWLICDRCYLNSHHRHFLLLRDLGCKAMEHLVSSWYNDRSLPESYILPPEERPGMLPLVKNIPVVDLGAHDQTDIIQRILEASQEFGMFQVPPTSFLFFFYQIMIYSQVMLGNFFHILYICVMPWFVPSNRWSTMESLAT